MWRLSAIVAVLILCGGCEKQVLAESEPASSAAAPVPTGNLQKYHREYRSKSGHVQWSVNPKYLDPTTAEAEAREQAAVDNCRLFGLKGYVPYIATKTDIPNIVSLILLDESRDEPYDQKKAWDFIVIYNKTIEAECDFAPAFKYAEEQERRRKEEDQRPAK